MPDTPDFETLARQLVESAFDEDTGPVGPPVTYDNWRQTLSRAIAAQLRLVWNARGAADITTLESELTSLMGATAGASYVKNLDRVLRALDR